MQLDIVTAERLLYSEEVDGVVAPGAAGVLGILPGHAPLLTTLAPGELLIDQGGEREAVAVSGGFLEVLRNKVTILADTAEQADEIDVERAEAALSRAEERVASAGSEMDLDRALRALRRSRARIAVARRRRTRATRSTVAEQAQG